MMLISAMHNNSEKVDALTAAFHRNGSPLGGVVSIDTMVPAASRLGLY